MPIMDMPYVVRYAATKTFWFFVRPARKLYRFLRRPLLRGANVAVFNEDKVLLVRPTYGRRLWTFPGGRTSRNETYEDAAIREVQEETGIKLSALKFICDHETTKDATRNIIRAFASQTDSIELEVDGIEIKEAGWFSLNDLPQDLNPRVSEALALYEKLKSEQ